MDKPEATTNNNDDIKEEENWPDPTGEMMDSREKYATALLECLSRGEKEAPLDTEALEIGAQEIFNRVTRSDLEEFYRRMAQLARRMRQGQPEEPGDSGTSESQD